MFAGIGMLARLNNKAASVPFVSCLVFPVCHVQMCRTLGASALFQAVSVLHSNACS